MAKEATIVNRIMAYLRAEGFFTWKNHGSQYSLAGLPDVMACREGQLWAIEVKQPGKQPTELQKHRLEELKNVGAVSFVAWSLEDVKQAVEGLGEMREEGLI